MPSPGLLPRNLRFAFLGVDLGFIAYWLVTALHLLPPEYLYQDYTNPILVAWNWSFAPLDLLVSATGLTSLWLHRRNDARAIALAIISLSLTSASGLQAIAFWTLRGDFDPMWWIPNLFLLLYPAFFLPGLVQRKIPV